MIFGQQARFTAQKNEWQPKWGKVCFAIRGLVGGNGKVSAGKCILTVPP